MIITGAGSRGGHGCVESGRDKRQTLKDTHLGAAIGSPAHGLFYWGSQIVCMCMGIGRPFFIQSKIAFLEV